MKRKEYYQHENALGLPEEEMLDLQSTVEDQYFVGLLHGTLLQRRFQSGQLAYYGKRFVAAGIITVVMIFATVANIIPFFKEGMAVAGLIPHVTQFDVLPAVVQTVNANLTMTTVECSVRLADINGRSIDKNANGQWELEADQDVLVWLDLPSNIEDLYADVKSTYPYEVKVGETGTIKFEVFCFDNDTKYTGTLDFVAADDLTIGSVCNGTNIRNQTIGINNDTCSEFAWMEPGKHAYIHYPLYTSCDGRYNVYPINGGRSSVGYDVNYNITAKGAPHQDHTDDYPGETAWLERYENSSRL